MVFRFHDKAVKIFFTLKIKQILNLFFNVNLVYLGAVLCAFIFIFIVIYPKYWWNDYKFKINAQNKQTKEEFFDEVDGLQRSEQKNQ